MGWKIGFNTPAIQARFGLSDPVVGYLTDTGVTPDCSTVTLAGWTAPAVEVELAVRVGEDGGVAGIGPALEFVDLDMPMADIEPVSRPTSASAGSCSGWRSRAWILRRSP